MPLESIQSDGEDGGGEFGIPVDDIHLEGPEIGVWGFLVLAAA